jgi:NRDE-2, necessary for RNA interference
MSEPKTNVPQFASFRPKPTTAVPEVAKAEKSSERKHHSRGKNETRDKDHRWRHHERRSRSWERSPPRELKIELSRAQPKDEPAGVFVIDRKGDEKNLIYGSIHRYSVPLFHRFGAGRVLGAPSDTKIDRDYKDEQGIVLSNWRDFRSGFREKYVFSKIEKERSRLLKIRPQVETEGQRNLEVDFVPLQGPRGRKRKRGENGNEDSSGSDYDERDYRSIYGKAKSKDQTPDEDFEYATESDSSGSEAGRTMKVDASIRQKNIELSRKVEDSPQDVDAWIALIDHQDALIRVQNDRHRVTNAEIRSTADIKIHMYEKALDKVRSLKDREKLLLGLMKEGEKAWEVEHQAERWEQISKDNIGSLLLWTSFLNFKQTTFSSFRHEDIKEVYLKRINTLSKALFVSGEGEAGSPYRQLIYLLLRFALFLRESGYSELAMSIWQGLLEMNFFAPDLQLSETEAMKSFSAFWETEVPRIGEDCALGWSHFVANEDLPDAPDALVDEATDVVSNKDLFKTWAAAERVRMMGARAPARTMDEVVEDDPFRVVLFSDIENFLIRLPLQSPDLQNLVLDGFLLFCRLPAIGSLDLEDSKNWSGDAFVYGHLLEYDMEWIKEAYFPASHKDGEESDLETSINVPIPNFSSSSEVLFRASGWSRMESWKDKYLGDFGPVSYKWVRNTLKQLTRTYFTEDLAEYYLAFEFLNEPATIKKISKSLLKQHPTSLRLYNSYALIEWSRGNRDVARGVFSAALNLRGSVTETDWDRNSILLWRSWMWACLAEQDNNTALQHLLSISDGSPNAGITLSPAAFLRAKQHLTSRRDYLISLGSSRSSVAYAECMYYH